MTILFLRIKVLEFILEASLRLCRFCRNIWPKSARWKLEGSCSFEPVSEYSTLSGYGFPPASHPSFEIKIPSYRGIIYRDTVNEKIYMYMYIFVIF